MKLTITHVKKPKIKLAPLNGSITSSNSEGVKTAKINTHNNQPQTIQKSIFNISKPKLYFLFISTPLLNILY